MVENENNNFKKILSGKVALHSSRSFQVFHSLRDQSQIIVADINERRNYTFTRSVDNLSFYVEIMGLSDIEVEAKLRIYLGIYEWYNIVSNVLKSYTI